MLIGLALLLLLAGCRRQEATIEITGLPASSPTPRSTPLPEIATAVPAGQEGNPVQMVIYSAAPRAAANFTARFETALNEASGLAIQVQVVSRYAEALAALCASADGTVSAAWMDGITYMAAVAQGCGEPVLMVERGTRRNARTGETGTIIVNSDSSITSAAQIKGKDFCRLGYADFWTWMVPSLVLQSKGVNPLADLKSITDYEDTDALIGAVAAGDCAAAGVASSALPDGDPPEGVTVLETTVEFPYAVLMLPPQLPLGARTALLDALTTMAEDTDSGAIMQGLLEQDALQPVTADDLADLTTFLQSTGLDFAQLGG